MRHVPVLLKKTIGGLNLKPGMTVIDCTLGAGGHAREILKAIREKGTLISFDADPEAIERTKKYLNPKNPRLIFINANFREVISQTDKIGVKSADAILLDLGLSSEQLEDSGRGFSFQKDEPLNMTLEGRKTGLTAHHIVNDWSEKDIGNVIYGYGEERLARVIARTIKKAREEKPIASSKELAAVIYEAVPLWYRRKRIHPATKTFQALRIAVNDELKSLEEGLQGGMNILKSEGRMAVIAFHGLESRIIKKFAKEIREKGEGKLILKHAVKSDKEERAANPRSRSARLYIMEKCK